jgi:hypothetical protein
LAGLALADVIPPPPPGSIPGKEYSNFTDHDMFGVADPHQNLNWDFQPIPADTFDYTGSGIPTFQPEVDALANIRDAFFQEVTRDTVTLLTSFTGIGDVHYTAAVHHGGSHAAPPNVGVWAFGPVDINPTFPPRDVDGLEVWGAFGADDANMFSLGADFTSGVSVWSYDSVGHVSTPYISVGMIAAAIGRPGLEQQIDLDAMMNFDLDDDPGSTATFGPGDQIMFSIAPIPMPSDGGAPLDGGEIWVWDPAMGPAMFLVHGGEVWDTAHMVAGHYMIGTDHENINALEAVPAPGAVFLLGMGGMVALRRRRS